MKTQLFTRTYLKGVSDGLIDQGALSPWGNDKIATEVFDKIASDHQLPAILERDLDDKVNISIGNHLLHWSKVAAEQNLGPGPTAVVQAKHASLADLNARAGSATMFYMDKAAEDGALNGEGTNTPEAAVATSSVARLDQNNRSTFMYLTGFGKTDMPNGGVIGMQMTAPMAPKGVSISNTLTSLDKQASESDFTKAANFIQALMNRQAAPTVKMVLAAATMAEADEGGLELMTDILKSVKTAEELDGALDAVNAEADDASAPPNAELVQLIEQALQHYFETHPSMQGGGSAEEPPAAEEEAPPADGPPETKAASVGPSVITGPRNLKEVPHAIAVRARHLFGKGVDAAKEHKGALGVGAGLAAAGGAGFAAGRSGGKKEGSLADIGHLAKGMKDRKALSEQFGKSFVDRSLKEHGKGAAKTVGKGLAAGAAAAGAGYAAGKATKSKKEAALFDFLAKAANTDGALNDEGPNTPSEAAQTSSTAKLDLANRKEKEYLNGMGETDMPNKGHIGETMDAPKGPAKTNPDTTPVKEAAYQAAVKSAAEYWGPKLPASMPQNVKTAHIVALAGMPEAFRADYVSKLS